MNTPLVFLGASAFPEVSQVVRDLNRHGASYTFEAVLDDDPSWSGAAVDGVPVVGGLDEARSFGPDAQFVFGIGSHRTRLIRRSILDRVGIPAERFPSLVHPRATVFDGVRIGHGCIVHAGAVIFAGAQVDDFVLVLANAVVGINNRIGEGAMLASLSTTTGSVSVGSYAYLGTACTVGESVSIGVGALVGIGSVLTKDLGPGETCFGNPARAVDRAELPQELRGR